MNVQAPFSAAVTTLFLLLSLIFSTPAHAQHDQHGDLTFTIYQNGITLVRDARTVRLDEGGNQLALYGLPASLQFNSVLPILNGTVSEVTLDMRQPGFQSVMQHLVGRQVRLDHTDGSSISGMLTHFRSNLIIIELSDGSSVVLPGLDGYRVAARDLPEVGRPYPRLNIDLQAARRGEQTVDLYYLMNALRWETEYTLVIDEDEDSAVLNGWNILQNRSDEIFRDVTVHLVAGDLNMGGGGPRPDMMMRAVAESVAFDGGQESSGLFEYERFSLPGVYTLQPAETAKRALIPEQTIPVNKRYHYTSSDRRMELPAGGLVQVQFVIDNARDGALGMVLPAGLVRMFIQQDGQLQVIGQDQLANTAPGSTIRLTTGAAFNILVQENVTRQNRISDRISEQSNRLTLTNEGDEDITVVVSRPIHTSQRVTDSNLPHTMPTAGQAVFEVPVPAGGTAVLEFTLRTER